MKRIIFWVFALILAFAPFSSCAEDIYQKTADEIMAYVMQGHTLQQWLDESVSPAAGSNMDYYVLQMNRFGADADFTDYVRTAAEMVQPGGISNPVTRQKSALSLISCGAIDKVPEALPDETIGKLGVMSYVYGLHLLNNGMSSELWSVETILYKILELQKADGGWAVMGQYGDTDVTAMCLQGLACNRGNNPLVAESISKALEFLSEKQLENGGYVGSGQENCESSAQVIVALSSLGIDACTDERFIKDDISVMDAMMQYRLPDGSFAHLPGDTTANDTACVQVLQALNAYVHIGERFFDFSGVEAQEYKNETQRSWKFWALIAVAGLCAAGVLFALTRKRGRVKQLAFVLAVSALAAAAILLINIESASSYYNVTLPKGDEVAGQAYISIRCDTVAGLAGDGSTPEDGIILEKSAIPFREGDSVFDVLLTAARLHRIQMEHDGGEEGMAYVTGINYLYEYTHGDLSGWIYSVNGETFSIGCGSYMVKDGDEILWQYTTQLGEDLR